MSYNNSITQEENDYAHDLLEIMLMMEGYDTEQIDEFLEYADEHDLNEQIERIISTDYSEIIISEGIVDLLEEEGYITEGRGGFIRGLWQGGKNWFKNLFGKGRRVTPRMPAPPKLTPEKVAPKTQAPKILGPDGKPVVKTPTKTPTKTTTKTPTKTTTKTPTKTTTKTPTKGNPLKTGAKLALIGGLGTLGYLGADKMMQGSGQDSNSNNNNNNNPGSNTDSNSDSNTRNQNGSGSGRSTMSDYLSAVNRGDSAEMERLAKGGKGKVSYDIRDRPTDARGGFDPRKEKTRWKYGQVYAVREDYYDIVANYLLEMGHADTLDEVNYIMLEMDGQTIASIAKSEIANVEQLDEFLGSEVQKRVDKFTKKLQRVIGVREGEDKPTKTKKEPPTPIKEPPTPIKEPPTPITAGGGTPRTHGADQEIKRLGRNRMRQAGY